MTKSKMLLAAAATLALGAGARLGPGKRPPPPSGPSCSCMAGSSTAPAGMDVYKILKKDGYDVTIVQNPTNSLADDVAVTKRAIAAAKGR